TAALPPPKPLAPAHNETSTNARPEFTWTAVAGAAAYEIEIAADYDFKTIVHPLTRVTGASFTPARPLHPAQRFWRVRVIDADGKPGPWSAAFVYKLKPPPPAETRPAESRPAVYPAHNQEGIVQQPSFTWPAEPGAAAYEIEIAADHDYKKVVLPPTRVETPRYVPLAPLYPSARFWRTRPVAADGAPGKWSGTRVYKLREPANKINIPATATLAQIRAAIDAAPDDSLITFAPGATYRIQPDESENFLTLEKRDDLILDGNGSLFIIETPTAGAVRMAGCRRVTLRRFRFDYDPPPHSIGTVVSVNTTGNPSNTAPAGATAAADKITAPATAGAAAPPIVSRPKADSLPNRKSKIENSITLLRLPGYPDFDAPFMLANWSFGMILDPVIPGRVKTGSPLVMNFPGAKVARHPADADLFDVGIPHANHGKFFAPGDRVIIYARKHGKSFCVVEAGSSDITFDRVVTHAAHAGHFLGINTSDVKLLSCASTPRDATRFYAGNADGAHFRANLLGPWIEGCTFDSIGDDGVALYNKGISIHAAPAPGTLTVDDAFMDLQPGDAFVIFNPFDGQVVGAPRTVTAVKPAAPRRRDITFTPALEPAAAAALPMGDATWWKNAQLFNRTRCNTGFVVKNNTFTSVRRYSVIARSTDGIIVDNTITGSSNAAITLLNEPHAWANGLHSERVLIARNKIASSTFDASSSSAAAIAVNLRSLADSSPEFRPKDGPAPLPARLHRAIRIEDNTITDWRHRAILLRGAADCVIRNNTIAAPAEAAAPAAAAGPVPADGVAIVLDNTENILLAGNDLTAVPAGRRLSITNSENTTTGGEATSGN
ncbi:MAG: right-handed parallel beta-helix repeat-containing protein, partial [Opitutaceae bacterium]|nr:right-handed parallel beta-helix repeat-containing protein [Opitutaceae bacterium]